MLVPFKQLREIYGDDLGGMLPSRLMEQINERFEAVHETAQEISTLVNAYDRKMSNKFVQKAMQKEATCQQFQQNKGN